jgi:hypothetical protein
MYFFRKIEENLWIAEKNILEAGYLRFLDDLILPFPDGPIYGY